MTRAVLMRTLPAFIVLLFLAPVAVAQAPSGPDCSEIGLTRAPLGMVEPGESVTYVQTVENKGPAPEVIVTVRAVTEGSDWTVTPDEKEVTVAEGESETVSFTVTAPADREAGDSKLKVAARGVCSMGGNAGPEQVFRTNEAHDTQSLRLAPAEGIQIPGLPPLDPTLVLGGGLLVAILGGGLLVARTRTRGVELRCSEPTKRLRPGRGTSFPVEVQNRSGIPESVTFQVGQVKEGWHAFMAVPEVQLAAREARTVWLMIRSPEDADVGAAATLTLTARSKQTPDKMASLAVRAEVTDDPAEAGVVPGDES